MFYAIAATSLLLCSAITISANEKPNFVFILVDDLGRQDLGVEGSEFYETPNIDSLAGRSARFTAAYSTCQVCSPSRASIQTGKYPPRVAVTDYIANNGSNQPSLWGRNTPLLPAVNGQELQLSETTIAEALKEHGYGTFFAGKWHLGAEGFGPRDQGYDINQGGFKSGGPPGGYHSPYRNPELSDDPPGSELPIRLGKETAKFITAKADAGEPFFAMLSFYSVHGPIQCSKARFEKFQAKAEKMGLTSRTQPRFKIDRLKEVRQVQDHPVYAGMMAALDDSVGIVLDAIQQAGVADNTVVIFTSDNGGVSSGDGFATACLPMRGGKGRQWEGGIRQPLYIVWPGVTEGQTVATPVIGTDFYPTILDIAGLPLRPQQHLDGVSLKPLLEGGSIPDRPLFWHYPHYGNQGGDPSSIVRDGDWKLIRYFADGRTELYNLAEDIGEEVDLASQEPQRVEAMSSRLEDWYRETNAKMPSKNPKFDEEKYARSERNLAKRVQRREAEHAGYMKADFTPRGGWWDLRRERVRKIKD